jgi:hypothetical protein
MAKKAKAKTKTKKVGRPSLDATAQQLLRNGHIALRLREELAKRDWKPPDLSDAMGSARDGVIAYRWLSGKGAPSPRFAEKLAALFGGTTGDFMPRNPDAVAPPATLPFMATEPIPPKRIHRPAAEVFAFTVNEHGMARIKLDTTLPMAKARSLFTTLLQSGLLPEGQDDEKQEEAEQ